MGAGSPPAPPLSKAGARLAPPVQHKSTGSQRSAGSPGVPTSPLRQSQRCRSCHNDFCAHLRPFRPANTHRHGPAPTGNQDRALGEEPRDQGCAAGERGWHQAALGREQGAEGELVTWISTGIQPDPGAPGWGWEKQLEVGSGLAWMLLHGASFLSSPAKGHELLSAWICRETRRLLLQRTPLPTGSSAM